MAVTTCMVIQDKISGHLTDTLQHIGKHFVNRFIQNGSVTACTDQLHDETRQHQWASCKHPVTHSKIMMTRLLEKSLSLTALSEFMMIPDSGACFYTLCAVCMCTCMRRSRLCKGAVLTAHEPCFALLVCNSNLKQQYTVRCFAFDNARALAWPKCTMRNAGICSFCCHEHMDEHVCGSPCLSEAQNVPAPPTPPFCC